jgi:integrase
LEEVQALLAVLPELASTAFAVAAFMGLRIGEIEALQWEDYRDGEMHISRSLERPCRRTQDPKVGRTRASDSPTRRTAGDAPATLSESVERADFREQPFQADEHE